jgi:hypothetical protein
MPAFADRAHAKHSHRGLGVLIEVLAGNGAHLFPAGRWARLKRCGRSRLLQEQPLTRAAIKKGGHSEQEK